MEHVAKRVGLRYVFSEIEKLRLAQMTCREGVMAVAKMLVAPNSSFHQPNKSSRETEMKSY
jgi:hypothetical protein